MKKLIFILFSAILTAGLFENAYASDWDVAGKVLTGIEGLRIITGGSIDIIGAFTGINRNREREVVYETCYYPRETHYRAHYYKRWVPYYVWRERWVPEYTVYDYKCGSYVTIEDHYERYRVEDGGYWVYEYSYDRDRY